MKKLSSETLSICNESNCLYNEFVVLPPNGDSGFNEYYEYKAEKIRSVKKLFSPLSQNMLMLSYPKVNSKEHYIFERFFESPTVIAKNKKFEGCFAIDVTEYINETTTDYFERLMSYIHYNPEIVFVLFIYSNNSNEIESFYKTLTQFNDFKRIDFKLPSANLLTEYTVSNLREFCLHIKNPLYAFINKYYMNKEVGFEFADYLVKSLKNKDFKGDLQMLKEVVKEIENDSDIIVCNKGIGY